MKNIKINTKNDGISLIALRTTIN